MTAATVVRCLIVISAMMALCPPAAAADASASAFTKLFIDACVPNIGRPDGVRAWAAAQGLVAITEPAALDLFVGGGDGSAWDVPSAAGRLVLSVRGRTQGCSVWARTAETTEVRADFVQLMEGVRRPGLTVSESADSHKPTPFGDYNVLSYEVTAPGARQGFVFILQTVERPGGAFQAWAEVAVGRNPA